MSKPFLVSVKEKPHYRWVEFPTGYAIWVLTEDLPFLGRPNSIVRIHPWTKYERYSRVG